MHQHNIDIAAQWKVVAGQAKLIKTQVALNILAKTNILDVKNFKLITQCHPLVAAAEAWVELLKHYEHNGHPIDSLVREAIVLWEKLNELGALATQELSAIANLIRQNNELPKLQLAVEYLSTHDLLSIDNFLWIIQDGSYLSKAKLVHILSQFFPTSELLYVELEKLSMLIDAGSPSDGGFQPA